ncbi:hypothetical protein H0484_03945 [Pusillimonas sp. CC-YST705]|uniref:Uncharacterized protein n=1 Tax=Mesopusillimonas faecipullorum TaxID=2755040 RepID=A0ABS8CA56_9BURK|nr:hypothetical protein [Mesopusillimonas faecipullorum]MCB5362907.1 hypothetical protein [Mesopusillimonas faecipullorum]
MLISKHLLYHATVLSAATRAPAQRSPHQRLASLFRAISYTFLLGLAVLEPRAHAEWRDPPSSLSFETPHGTLSVQTSEYFYDSRLYLDGTPLQPAVQGRLDITYAYQIDDAHAALIAISDGETQCAVHYMWVVLDRTGYRISPRIGSCSKQIKVAAKGSQLVLTTPSAQHADKVDVYTYDGTAITKRTRAATKAEVAALLKP